MIGRRALSPRAAARQWTKRLVAREDGVTAIEFALVSPVFLMMILGSIDLAQASYGATLLNGAVQRAARSSTLETANTLVADDMVKKTIAPILPGATVTSVRTSYYDFVDIGRPEKWNDLNNDGQCNNNEAYVDENSNGQWDKDIGVEGNGGASDVIVYSVTVTYPAVVQVPLLPTDWFSRTLKATTIKKNQPFAYQEGYGSSAGSCK